MIAWWVAAALAGPIYEEVTAASGLQHTGASFGAAVEDADGDGDLDVWLTNHDDPPTLFIQVAPGRFVDETAARLDVVKRYDAHGPTWLDIDGDGDLDLIEAVGAQQGRGVGRNRVWVRDARGHYTDAAERLGLLFPQGSSRMAFPLDADGDGVMDVLIATLKRPDSEAPTSLWRGLGAGRYAPPEPATDREPTVLHGLSVVDVQGDGTPEIVQWGKPDMVQVLRRREGLWRLDWKMAALMATEEPGNVVLGDVNGDGLLDVVVLRGTGPMGLRAVGDREVRASWGGKPGDGMGLTFQTTGEVTVSVGPEHIWRDGTLHVGKGCDAVPGTAWTGRADGRCAGVARGVAVSREGSRWTVAVHAPGWVSADLRITSTQAIAQPAWTEEVPPAPFELQPPSVFLGTREGRFEVAPPAWQLGGPQPCAWGSLHDVDHDGDLDLYLVCADAVGNLPNRLFRNTGTGWTAVTGHGAEGSALGHGDAAVVADLDGDGWEDLLLLNGHGGAPWDVEGPVQVLRHRGGAATTVTLEVQGPPGHRSAEGAVVKAWIGDRVLRRDVGLAAPWVQGPRVLHLGLGTATRIDRLEVVFPGGAKRVLTQVDAGQSLVITAPPPGAP